MNERRGPLTAQPKAIRWLEEQTGQSIDDVSSSPEAGDRHLSVRLGVELAEGLDAMARERGCTVSQFVRELLTDVVSQRASAAAMDGRALADHLAADIAEVCRRLAG